MYIFIVNVVQIFSLLIVLCSSYPNGSPGVTHPIRIPGANVEENFGTLFGRTFNQDGRNSDFQPDQGLQPISESDPVSEQEWTAADKDSEATPPALSSSQALRKEGSLEFSEDSAREDLQVKSYKKVSGGKLLSARSSSYKSVGQSSESSMVQFATHYPHKLGRVSRDGYKNIIGTEFIDRPPYYRSPRTLDRSRSADTMLFKVPEVFVKDMLRDSNVLPPESIGDGVFIATLHDKKPVDTCTRMDTLANDPKMEELLADAMCVRLFASAILRRLEVDPSVSPGLENGAADNPNLFATQGEILAVEQVLFQKFPRVMLILGNREWFRRISPYIINWNTKLLIADPSLLFNNYYDSLLNYHSNRTQPITQRLSLQRALLYVVRRYVTKKPAAIHGFVTFVLRHYGNPRSASFFDFSDMVYEDKPVEFTGMLKYVYKVTSWLYGENEARAKLFKLSITRVFRPLLRHVIEFVKHQLRNVDVANIVDTVQIVDSTFQIISVNLLPKDFFDLMKRGIARYADSCGPLVKKNIIEQLLLLTADQVPERTVLYTLINSGGVFVQTLFQMLARYMEDTELKAEFSKLFDHVSPLEYKVAQDVVSSSFEPLNKLGVSTPALGPILGSASVAQVHLATWYHKGYDQHVVVKVRRPKVNIIAEQELLLFKKIAGNVSSLRAIVNDTVTVLSNEVDFGNEAKFWKLGKELYEKPHMGIYVPDCFSHTTDVIVLGRAYGRTLSSWLQEPSLDLRVGFTLAQRLVAMLKVWFEEALFGSGFFHSDLHPGNIMFEYIEERPLESPLSVVDFGQSAILSTEQQALLLLFAMGVQLRSSKMIMEALEPYYVHLSPAQVTHMHHDVQARLGNFTARDSQSVTKLTSDLTNMFISYGLEFPAPVLFFYRARVLIERSILELREKLLVYDVEIPEPEDVYRSVALAKREALKLAVSHLMYAANLNLARSAMIQLQRNPVKVLKLVKSAGTMLLETFNIPQFFRFTSGESLSSIKNDVVRELQQGAEPLTLKSVLEQISADRETAPLLDVDPTQFAIYQYLYGPIAQTVKSTLFNRYMSPVQEVLLTSDANKTPVYIAKKVDFADRVDVFRAPETGDLVFYLDKVLYAIQDYEKNCYYYSPTGRRLMFQYDRLQKIEAPSSITVYYSYEHPYPIYIGPSEEDDVSDDGKVKTELLSDKDHPEIPNLILKEKPESRSPSPHTIHPVLSTSPLFTSSKFTPNYGGGVSALTLALREAKKRESKAQAAENDALERVQEFKSVKQREFFQKLEHSLLSTPETLSSMKSLRTRSNAFAERGRPLGAGRAKGLSRFALLRESSTAAQRRLNSKIYEEMKRSHNPNLDATALSVAHGLWQPLSAANVEESSQRHLENKNRASDLPTVFESAVEEDIEESFRFKDAQEFGSPVGLLSRMASVFATRRGAPRRPASCSGDEVFYDAESSMNAVPSSSTISSADINDFVDAVPQPLRKPFSELLADASGNSADEQADGSEGLLTSIESVIPENTAVYSRTSSPSLSRRRSSQLSFSSMSNDDLSKALGKQVPSHLRTDGISFGNIAQALYHKNLPPTLRSKNEPLIRNLLVLELVNARSDCSVNVNNQISRGVPFACTKLTYESVGQDRRKSDWPVSSYPRYNFDRGFQMEGTDYSSLPRNFLCSAHHARDSEIANKRCGWISKIHRGKPQRPHRKL